ncbi:hypothetical protein ACET3Z_032821 [Daucus carota]
MQSINHLFALPPSTTKYLNVLSIGLRRNSLSLPILSPAHASENRMIERRRLITEAAGADVLDNDELLLDEKFVLEAGLQIQAMPKHLAVIADGHRRWARQKGMPAKFGHTTFVPGHRELARLCCKCGIKALTAFLFSPGNWKRPKEQVEFMMSLFEEGLRSNLEPSMRHDIRISIIGDRRGLSKSFQEVITEAEEKTRANTRLHIILAINYGGQSEIVEACRTLCKKVKEGLIEEEEINQKMFEQELWTNICPEFPFPDMLIRFSGEQRLSDFLAYQLAYAELYFPETLFPDFGEEEFLKAMKQFQQRKRRYGGGE